MGQKQKRPSKIGTYPTDDKGFPIHPYEVSVSFKPHRSEGYKTMNNHHLAFCARTFGEFAISQTFRDLRSNQQRMSRWKHQLLHSLYDGIVLPPFSNMLDRIDEERQAPGALQIYSSIDKHYNRLDITEVTWSALKQEYDLLESDTFILDLKI